MEKPIFYYVYILASRKNGTLYIGMTSDLIKRIYQHKNDLVEGFTKNTESIHWSILSKRKTLTPHCKGKNS